MKKNLGRLSVSFLIIIFTIIPLGFVDLFSITVQTASGIVFSLDNFRRFLEPVYLKVLMRVIVGCAKHRPVLLLGYPAAQF